MRTCAFLFAALSAIAQSVNFYSLQREAQLGAGLAGDVLKQSTPTAHENVREYVERLGDRISSKLPPSPFRYKFAVIVEEIGRAHV